MASQQHRDVFEACAALGCCRRCALRFTCDYSADYANIEEYLRKAEFAPAQDQEDPQDAKRSKSNPCVVCLGLLQEDLLQQMMASEELKRASEYDCETFTNFVSLPVAVMVREHSMRLHVQERFEGFYREAQAVCALNKAWSWTVQERLAKAVGKRFDRTSGLHIQFSMGYGDEEREVALLKRSFRSRNAIGDFLASVDAAAFRRLLPQPPQVPSAPLTVDAVSCRHEAVHVAGRYCKYARDIGQTPWVVDGVKVVQNSVQEVIFGALEAAFPGCAMVFSASGREDVDVRTLGRGRPFFVKVNDPKTLALPRATFRAVEAEAGRGGVVGLRDLQFVDKRLLGKVKEGEQEKQKSYRALCVVLDDPQKLDAYVERINGRPEKGAVTLAQRTPIRVCHRRSQAVRSRGVLEMSARVVEALRDKGVFELDVVTQAGTYVKEFVHGDLGRTRPNLGQLIGAKVDILALDVTDIDLDFPPALN